MSKLCIFWLRDKKKLFVCAGVSDCHSDQTLRFLMGTKSWSTSVYWLKLLKLMFQNGNHYKYLKINTSLMGNYFWEPIQMKAGKSILYTQFYYINFVYLKHQNGSLSMNWNVFIMDKVRYSVRGISVVYLN